MKQIFSLFMIITLIAVLLLSCSTLGSGGGEDLSLDEESLEEVEIVDEPIKELPEDKGDFDKIDIEPEIEQDVIIEPEPPSPLTPWAIYRFIFKAAGEGWSPVHKKGVPVLLFHDIDGNGYNDVFALYIDRNSLEESELDILSDFSRLYDLEIDPFRVECRLFFQKDSLLIPGYSIDLGKKLVIDEMSKFQISETVQTPFALSINFQNPEGTERTWIFCGEKNYEKLTLHETFAAFIDIKDINTDGLTDILHFEKHFEAGMGYETYITWYNWNDITYRQYKITNILRNLHEFLDTTKEYFINQQWDDLIEFGLPGQQLKMLLNRGVTKKDIIQSLFIPSTRENGAGKPELIDLTIEDVIFPEILENPFQPDVNGTYVFPLRVRIIAENGEYLYISRIGMKENPFQPRQFYFIVMSENVYN